MTDKPPADPAEQFAHDWHDPLDQFCSIRMEELGISPDWNGEPDYEGDGRWRAFDPSGRKGGSNTTGIVVDSGVLNPDRLEGGKGRRLWSRMRLRDRIDAIISHEYEELRLGLHGAALTAAAKTDLPIRDAARRLNRARAR